MVHYYLAPNEGEDNSGAKDQQSAQIQQGFQSQQTQYYTPSPPKLPIARISDRDRPSTTRPRRISRKHATNACVKCRERKTKCTAETDRPCANCRQNNYSCEYTAGKRERAKREREELEKECTYLRRVVANARRQLEMTADEILALEFSGTDESDDPREHKRVKYSEPTTDEEAMKEEPAAPVDANLDAGVSSGANFEYYVDFGTSSNGDAVVGTTTMPMSSWPRNDPNFDPITDGLFSDTFFSNMEYSTPF